MDRRLFSPSPLSGSSRGRREGEEEGAGEGKGELGLLKAPGRTVATAAGEDSGLQGGEGKREEGTASAVGGGNEEREEEEVVVIYKGRGMRVLRILVR